MNHMIAVVGIGYVGLRNVLSIAKAGLRVIGFDINKARISDLKQGIDNNDDVGHFESSLIEFTDDEQRLKEVNYFLISVPTPINEHKVPNIFPLKSASLIVSKALKKGDVVILESTVFPGATRELMIPILEQESGLKVGVDFFVGYSSERINPGDLSHNESNTTKVISGYDTESLDRIKSFYEKVYTFPVYCAKSLEIAESSKLLENIQRDVNIALVNEFAQIVDKKGISMHEVLDASKTKWNFLPFHPGLVGGHCIPEDPYYFIYEANKVGAQPNLISCARQVNENFYHFIVEKVISILSVQGVQLKGCKIVLMGLSFKPNVKDVRHSMSFLLYHQLKALGMDVYSCDPLIELRDDALHWIDLDNIEGFSAIILCQAHDQFINVGASRLSTMLIQHGVFIDIPGSFYHSGGFREDIKYWGL